MVRKQAPHLQISGFPDRCPNPILIYTVLVIGESKPRTSGFSALPEYAESIPIRAAPVSSR